jgi:peptidyl-prolyl cis-trans isomerase A (cyclophilin A)
MVAFASHTSTNNIGEQHIMVELHTNHGIIKIELDAEKAPKSVENFLNYVKKGHYDNTVFHRVIDGFMIQGGDPLGTGTGGPGYEFADEFHPDLQFDRPYLLAMANAGPGTNGSQFFITVVPTPHLNGRHTIFGEVIDGSDVIEEISRVQTGRNDRPVQDVVLESVEIERQDGTGESAG